MMRRVGKYEILRPIATGGMATVYLGRSVGAGGFERLVAVKLMHPHLVGEREYVDMFLDEARLAARIRHPNVVPTLDIDETDEGVPAIVMELVEGPTLGAIFKLTRQQGERIPIDYALRIMLDALAGLHAAHELRGPDKQLLHLVHRDVSPQNVMVGHDGVSRITDFGVARARVRLHSTRDSQLKGKLAYLAPEQLKGIEVDRRADVYSAGVVLWEMLTGARLFKAQSEAELMALLLQGPKQTPRELQSDVPATVDRVVMRALAVDREARFVTAAAFADALDAAAVVRRIASQRALAEWVRSLPIELPRASDVPPAPESDTSVPSLPRPPALPSVPEPSGSIGAAALPAPVPRSRLPVLAAALGGALVTVIGATVLWMSRSDRVPESAAIPAAPVEQTPAAAPTAAPTAAPPAVPVSAEPAPEPVVSASSVPASVPPLSMRPPPRGSSRPPAPPPPTKKGYRPDDL
jgi:eukaryotic-like serine/threonine-protein kinase